MKKVNIHQMVFCALFAALIVVFAQIQVPLPGLVPISLATFGVMMAGLLLGWKFGLMAVAVYVLLGAVGVPVFIGYLPYAVLAGLPVKKAQESFWGRMGLLALGTFACYLLGTTWFMHATGRTLGESMGLCVLPFLPGDAVKMALASFLTPRLRKAIKA